MARRIRDRRLDPMEKKAMAGESEFAQQMYQKSPEELREIILKELGEASDHLHQLTLRLRGARDVYPDKENIVRANELVDELHQILSGIMV